MRIKVKTDIGLPEFSGLIPGEYECKYPQGGNDNHVILSVCMGDKWRDYVFIRGDFIYMQDTGVIEILPQSKSPFTHEGLIERGFEKISHKDLKGDHYISEKYLLPIHCVLAGRTCIVFERAKPIELKITTLEELDLFISMIKQ